MSKKLNQAIQKLEDQIARQVLEFETQLDLQGDDENLALMRSKLEADTKLFLSILRVKKAMGEDCIGEREAEAYDFERAIEAILARIQE